MGSQSTITYTISFLFLNRKYRFDFVFEFRPGSICLPATQNMRFHLLFFFLNLLPSQDLNRLISYTSRL